MDILVEDGRAVVVRHIEIQRTLLMPMIHSFKVGLIGREGDNEHAYLKCFFGVVFAGLFKTITLSALLGHSEKTEQEVCL